MVWMSQGMAGGSYLGVGVADVDDERAKALKLRETRGVELTSIAEDSPASKAGLKTGDVVMEFNGQRVEGLDQFMRYVRETPPNREVKIAVSREGKLQTFALTTAKRKPMVAFRDGEPMRIEIPRIEMPRMEMPDTPRMTMSWRSGMLGIEGEGLEGQLAEFFGVKDGVLVRSVGKDTAAEKAGLKVGDVITKVDGTPVNSTRQITNAIRAMRDKKTFPVTVVREKRESSMNVTIEDAERPAPPRGRSVNNDE
jgi:serine protease Do